MRRRSSQTSPLILAQSPCEKCLLRESSFNMTKGGGGGEGLEIFRGRQKCLDTRKGDSEKIVGVGGGQNISRSCLDVTS